MPLVNRFKYISNVSLHLIVFPLLRKCAVGPMKRENINFSQHVSNSKLEFRESDVLPGRTEVRQSNFVEFISRAKGYLRETYKSKNINPISSTPKFTLDIIQIKVISLSTSFQC